MAEYLTIFLPKRLGAIVGKAYTTSGFFMICSDNVIPEAMVEESIITCALTDSSLRSE